MSRCRSSKMHQHDYPGDPSFRYYCCLQKGHRGNHSVKIGPGQWDKRGKWINRPHGEKS